MIIFSIFFSWVAKDSVLLAKNELHSFRHVQPGLQTTLSRRKQIIVYTQFLPLIDIPLFPLLLSSNSIQRSGDRFGIVNETPLLCILVVYCLLSCWWFEHAATDWYSFTANIYTCKCLGLHTFALPSLSGLWSRYQPIYIVLFFGDA